jgi:acyl-CoA reductase-like NAD-dependent aldehyde dehydrogenase
VALVNDAAHAWLTTLLSVVTCCSCSQWNAPLLLFALKLAPALVAGNAVVLKSAEAAPFGTALLSPISSQRTCAGVQSSAHKEDCRCAAGD